ncbi:MAG: FAD-dependent oxidoreductase [Clostridia bacterium]|nr:FAD-dependent oxidoreductase [Clostridia bacterium]
MLDVDIEEMANYCLNCKNKPCSNQGCPMHTPIPDFIDCIKNEKIDYAYKILTDNNIFSHICSIVCPQEKQCEGKCVRGIKGNPVSIGKLEKFVNQTAREDHLVILRNKKEKNGKKVAIIGSGPAGLECAYELALAGFEVDVFEKENFAGGILKYGIPDFRLDKGKVDRVIRKIKKQGVHFYFKKCLGKNIDIQELKEDYDYIFISIGLSKQQSYQLNAEHLEGIYKSDKFLRAYYNKKYIENLGEVVIIGGGNVAMDCARVAIRMGATKSKILYRRDRNYMPASESELEDAINEGVEFKELVRVDSANGENGRVVTVNCAVTEIVDGKAVDKGDAELYTEKADTVVFAIGSKTDSKVLEACGLKTDEKGYLIVDENGMTSIENVYAGGDLTENNSTVCYALASGKRVAQKIIEKESK